MRTIEIDDEVFGYLQSKAISYVETTPNLTLRRLFGLDIVLTKSEDPKSKVREIQEYKNPRRKQPKTDLQQLIQASLLQERQTLYLYDYQGNQISGYDSTISGKKLLWNNITYSMSKLAERGLRKEGFSSESVRGPAHWFNSDGISVKELWKQYLETK